MNLKVYLATKNMEAREFARRLGCDPALLCRVAYGKQTCSKEFSRRVEEATEGKVVLRLDAHFPDTHYVNYADIVPSKTRTPKANQQLAATA